MVISSYYSALNHNHYKTFHVNDIVCRETRSIDALLLDYKYQIVLSISTDSFNKKFVYTKSRSLPPARTGHLLLVFLY